MKPPPLWRVTLRPARRWQRQPIAAPVIALAALTIGCQRPPAPGCDDMFPAWSPDGRRVVFTSTRTGDPEIFVMTVGGSEPALRLTHTPGRDAHPSFSPDGTTIAFQSPREPGGHTNLYLMNADGSDQRRLTSHSGFAGVPVWSPGGRRIAYQWTPELSVANWRLMLLDMEPGAEPRPLTDGAANDQVINWAPDGRGFAFHSDRTGVNQVYTLALDGAVRQLTDDAAPSQSAAWSPDGTLIAFRSDRDGATRAVYAVQADGTGTRRIGSLAGEHGIPFFSPDGTRLLATRAGASGSEIVTLRLSDGAEEPLSRCVPAGR